jgi:hypothetical protein
MLKLYAGKEYVLNKSASRSVKVGLHITEYVAVPMLLFFGDMCGAIALDAGSWTSLKEEQSRILDYLDGDVAKFDSIKIEDGRYILKLFGNVAGDSRIIGFRQTNISSKQSHCIITGRVTLDNLFALLPCIDNYMSSLHDDLNEINHALLNIYKTNETLPNDKKITKGGLDLQALFKELTFA